MKQKKYLLILLHIHLVTSEIFKKNQSDFLNDLKKWGFKINEDNKVLNSINQLIEFHKSLN